MGAAPAWAEQVRYNAGYRSLVTRLPGSRVRLDVAVWYPASRAPSAIKTGSWTFSAARNAPPLPGPWPLIMLSHDSSGSRFAHNSLAISLVQLGFMVAAPTHDGDNVEDMRLLFSDLQLPIRAHQLRAAMDLLLDNELLGPLVDRRRTALVGFGRGGTAALLLLGARLSPDIWPNYCAHMQAAGQSSPYCEPFVAEKMNELILSMRNRAQQMQESARMREEAELARSAALRRANEGIAKAYGRVQKGQKSGTLPFPSPPFFLPTLPPLRELVFPDDRRYQAMIFISPGYSMLFDPESLRQISLPILLVGLDKEPLDRPAQQALAFRSLLAPPTPDYLELTGADIPAFQSPCPPDMSRDLPDLCNSVTLDEREDLQNRLQRIILDYLAKVWR